MKTIFKSIFILLSMCLYLNSLSQSNTTSLLFDGLNDHVTFDSNNIYNMGTNSFTHQLYFKINDSSNISNNKYHLLFAKGASIEIDFYGFFIDIRNNFGNNKAHVIIGSNGQKIEALSSSIIQENIWYNLALVIDKQSNELRLYINGELEQEISITSIGSLNNDWPIQIGRYLWISSGNTDHYLDGNLDEIITWNYALTKNEIEHYMHCPPAGNEPELIAYWNFEEGIGGFTYDQKTNNLGNLNGANWSDDVVITHCCTPNLITNHPQDTYSFVGDTVQFSVNTTSTNISYQWQVDSGFGYNNISNAGQFSGVNTSNLSIANVTSIQNNWLIRCVITENINCVVTSNEAKLNVDVINNVNNPSDLNKVQIYPNPFSENITIQFEKIFNGRVLINDIIGKTYLDKKINSNSIEIDLHTICTKGLYTLTFIDSKTKVKNVSKIICK